MSKFPKKIDGPTDPAEELLAGRHRAGLFGVNGAMDNLNQFIEEGRVVLNEVRPIVTAVAAIVKEIRETGRFSTDLQLPDGPIKITIHLPTDGVLPKG